MPFHNLATQKLYLSTYKASVHNSLAVNDDIYYSL